MIAELVRVLDVESCYAELPFEAERATVAGIVSELLRTSLPAPELLKSRCLEILQVHKARDHGKGWFELAGFSHELNHLT